MFWDTIKSMENKSTSSQLPTALRLGNTVTTDKFMIINHNQTADVLKELQNLDPYKSAGLDNLDPLFLKLSAALLLSLLPSCST